MPKRPQRIVREPLQVYLSSEEREALDRIAALLGVSRAEVLRRGIEAVSRETYANIADPMDDLVGRYDELGAPTDLAVRHDDYLAGSLDEERKPKSDPSS